MPGVDILTQIGNVGWATVDAAGLQRALQRARYDLMGVASRRALAGDLSAGNAEVKAALDAVPQLRGWVTINPAFPDRSAEELRKYVSSAKWLGAVLNPGLSGQSLESSATREVLNAFRRFGKPVLIHIETDTDIRALEDLAQEFNTLKFIAGSAGGPHWQTCTLVAKRQTNIFVEPFSGGVHRGKLEAILQSLGPHRVVFASNFPQGNPGAALGLLLDARLSDGEKQSILTGSAVRLFGLQRSEE
jgi:predicted TIM-barrel fold metal-dependent hydrolase